MNPELPPHPRAELEARVTVYLLGELPAHEAAAFRQILDEDAELAKLYERLKPTIKLVAESAKSVQAEAAPAAPLKLSEDRRQKLLAQFKTIASEEFATPKTSKKFSWLLLFAAAAAIIIVAIPLFLPALAKSKSKAVSMTSDNMRGYVSKRMELAQRQEKFENNSPEPSPATPAEIPPPASSVAPDAIPLGDVPAPRPQTKIVLPSAGDSLEVADAKKDSEPGNEFQKTAPNQNYFGDVNGQVTAAGQANATSSQKIALLGQMSVTGSLFSNRKSEASKLGVTNGVYGFGGANKVDGFNLNVVDAPVVTAESGRAATSTDSPGDVTFSYDPQTRSITAMSDSATFDAISNEVHHTQAASLDRAAELYYNAGKLDQAEAKANEAYQSDPSNQTAYRYLLTLRQRRASDGARLGQLESSNGQLVDATDWAKDTSQNKTPIRAAKSMPPGSIDKEDLGLAHAATPAPIPQPEIRTTENAFSTFSLNVADVSFKLAAASLQKGVMPDPGSIRSEEFINAFDYRDPDPAPGAPLGFASDCAHYPFVHNRDLLRFSVKTAAAGRPAGRALNIVLLLDNSGSMERADRVQIIHEALRVLAAQLQPQDKLSIVTFARTPRLWVDGVSGSEAGVVVEKVSGLTPQGGTNLEDAMKLAYETARRHYLGDGINRVVLLTDGAANLGNVNPVALKQKVEENRRQGIALDCFGIGWEGYNDDLLETLSRNGDGRYGFLNTPAEAATDFAGELAGALNVAAADVKVQVEFNPKRVTSYRQIGYAKQQLTKEQFRDNTVDAAEIGAAESGNALYVVEINPNGEGALATVHVRYKVPGTSDYREHAWDVPYTGKSVSLDQASPALRLATTASAFSEWLADSPYAAEVTPDQLLGYLAGVPKIYGADQRPAKLEMMIRQAKAISGK